MRNSERECRPVSTLTYQYVTLFSSSDVVQLHRVLFCYIAKQISIGTDTNERE